MVTELNGEQIKPLSWQERLKKNWADVRLAHEGMMLDKIGKQNQIVRDSIRKIQGGDMQSEGDDMGVNIGNEIHYHQESQTNSPIKSLASKLAPYVIGALGAGVVGIGVAALSDKAMPAAPAAATDTDTVNQYNGGFGEPEAFIP